MTRAPTTGIAVLLLAVDRVTPYDGGLIALALAYSTASMLAFARSRRLRRSPAAWLGDAAAVLALIAAAQDWRSPFYLLGLTTLVLPATTLPFRRALMAGFAYTAGYLGAAIAVGLDLGEVRTSARVETLATHLMVPGLVALALAYAAEALRELRSERARAERLAIEAERRRIAWELHDSAKQRVHAAHLVLSSVEPAANRELAERLQLAVTELEHAAADMDTSVTDLQMPLEERSLEQALRERAAELGPAAGIAINIRGHAPALPPLVAAHVHRIACEALTNAARHSGASRIDVRLDGDERHLRVVVQDDGQGMPAATRPGASGLRSMHNRASTLGASLTIAPRDDSRGTAVRLEVPLSDNKGAPP